ARNAISRASAAFSPAASAAGAPRGSGFWIARAITGVTGRGREPCVCSQIMAQFCAAGAWQEKEVPPKWLNTGVVARTGDLGGRGMAGEAVAAELVHHLRRAAHADLGRLVWLHVELEGLPVVGGGVVARVMLHHRFAGNQLDDRARRIGPAFGVVRCGESRV